MAPVQIIVKVTNPLRKKKCMLGDNKSAVDSSRTSDSKINKIHKINKSHVSLLFHRVRETIAAGIIS